jgi:hypothetical protein
MRFLIDYLSLAVQQSTGLLGESDALVKRSAGLLDVNGERRCIIRRDRKKGFYRFAAMSLSFSSGMGNLSLVLSRQDAEASPMFYS